MVYSFYFLTWPRMKEKRTELNSSKWSVKKSSLVISSGDNNGMEKDQADRKWIGLKLTIAERINIHQWNISNEDQRYHWKNEVGLFTFSRDKRKSKRVSQRKVRNAHMGIIVKS